MVSLYVALIIHGRRTFGQVPRKFKAAVKDDLNALGLDENGNPLPLAFEEPENNVSNL